MFLSKKSPAPPWLISLIREPIAKVIFPALEGREFLETFAIGSRVKDNMPNTLEVVSCCPSALMLYLTIL